MGVDYAGGWDAVIATGFANVNRVLGYAYQHNVTPHEGTIKFDVPVGPVKIPADVFAMFGPWMMTGGSGQNVIIRIPLTNGKATVGNLVAGLAGVNLRVQILLRFVKSTVHGGGTSYQLVLTFTDPSAIVSLDIENPPPAYTKDDVTALAIALRNLLQAHTAKEGITIANLDLSQIAANYPWLMPNRGLNYAAGSNASRPNDGQLGLLIASINPPPGVPPTLQNGVIPGGCDAALVLSNMIFSKYFLAPAFASSLNVGADRFSYRGLNPTTLVLNGNTSVSGATITSAQATANNDAVTIVLQGHASPMKGVDVNFTVNATYRLVLGGTADNPVLTFQRTSESESHSTDIAWWVYVVSGLSGGAIGLMVVELIKQVVNNSAGSSLRGTMPASFAKSVAWPYYGSVVITQALLPTPLQLGGRAQG